MEQEFELRGKVAQRACHEAEEHRGSCSREMKSDIMRAADTVGGY